MDFLKSIVESLDNLTLYGEQSLLALRLALAAVFLVHGLQKLRNRKNSSGFFIFLGVCETLGGLALALGLFTSVAAIGLGIIMLGAIYHKLFLWKMPFTAMDKTGWEMDLILLAALAAVIFLGPGEYSIDYSYLLAP